MTLEKEDKKLYNIAYSYENLILKDNIIIARILCDIIGEITILIRNCEELLKSYNIFLKNGQILIIFLKL